jgi:hypothetical protein
MLPSSDVGWLDFFNKLYIWSTLAAIVLGAVALVASNGMRILGNRVSAAQNKQISEANERASGANERAGKANESAGKANVEAGKANERAANLELRASKAEERAKVAESQIASANATAHEASAKVAAADARSAEAQRGAAEASAKAESFRLDIARANQRASEADLARRQLELQLAERFADRTISPSQQARITDALKALKGESMDVVIFGDTPEITKLSSLLLDCLVKSEWPITLIRPLGVITNAEGVLVSAKPGAPELSKMVELIVAVLKESLHNGAAVWDFEKLNMAVSAANVSTFNGASGGFGKARVRIVIGSK